ncbi:MAG: GlsB/YeaQ/YmgE family stress response membrane protein [Bacteroidota bacterium]
MSLIVVIIVGAIAGWLAGQIMKGKGYGFLTNLVLGILGSVVGDYLFRELGINLNIGNGLLESIVVAAAGAVVILFVAGLFKR